MGSLILSEWYKLRKTKGVFVIFSGPLFIFPLGLLFQFNVDLKGVNEWYGVILGMNVTYGLLFLPLMTGVLASLICRFEHQAGGWKQLLSLPVTRGKVFLAKFILIMMLVFVIQLLYLGSIYGVGTLKGLTDPFPLDIIWKSIIGGWVATFPLVALQLGLSILFKSFAAPLSVNAIFTLPTILAVNSERFGPYYPWAQPFLMMNIGGEKGDVFFVPWEQLLTVVGGSFILFFACSFIYFQRKAV